MGNLRVLSVLELSDPHVMWCQAIKWHSPSVVSMLVHHLECDPALKQRLVFAGVILVHVCHFTLVLLS